MSTSSAKEAGMLFCTYWERPGNEETAVKRGEMAEEYYATIMSAGPMGMNSNIDYVNWAIGIAKDDSKGYCQGHRNENPDYDCSSLVYYSLLHNGFDVGAQGAAFATGTMDAPLTRLGFQKIHISSYDELMPGDILWKAEHTELYVGNGKKVGAHTNEIHNATAESPQHGDQTGNEISVKDIDDGWEWVYRRR